MSKKHVTLTQFKLLGQRVSAFIVLLSQNKQDKISGHMTNKSTMVVVTDNTGNIAYRTTDELKGDLGIGSSDAVKFGSADIGTQIMNGTFDYDTVIT